MKSNQYLKKMRLSLGELHIQVEIHGEIRGCLGNLHTLNMFIPNVDARFKVKYKR